MNTERSVSNPNQGGKINVLRGKNLESQYGGGEGSSKQEHVVTMRPVEFDTNRQKGERA